MTPPPSLLDPSLAPLWSLIADKLARNGTDWRGRVTLPELTASARLAVQSLVERPIRRTVSLADLEAGLQRLDVGADLLDALERLGHPVPSEPAERRAARQVAKAAREAARARAATWPEPWAPGWIDEVISAKLLAGLDADAAVRLVDSVRTVLDVLAGSGADAPVSRVELAARHLGDAHAIDRGSRLERATTRALHAAEDASEVEDVWARAGVHADLLSATVLTWNLPIADGHPLHRLVAASADLSLPCTLTHLALRRHPLTVRPDADVLFVENPRVVERAIQDGSPLAMVCGNGNPSTTVRLLAHQLLEAGATVRYHGDFDAAGLAICARMHALGLQPWRMTEADYDASVARAEHDGVVLPIDRTDAGPTPWAPRLADRFNRLRRIVHEERVIDEILS